MPSKSDGSNKTDAWTSLGIDPSAC